MPAKKQRRNISPEERKRRSEWARNAHKEKVVDPETGEERPKFGGAENARKGAEKRASKSIAEAVDTRQGEIQDALFSGLDKRNQPDVRRRAAKELLGIARQERIDELAERRALDDEKRTELLGGVLRELEARRRSSGGVLDGDVSGSDQGRPGLDPPVVLELEAGDWSED